MPQGVEAFRLARKAASAFEVTSFLALPAGCQANRVCHDILLAMKAFCDTSVIQRDSHLGAKDGEHAFETRCCCRITRNIKVSTEPIS